MSNQNKSNLKIANDGFSGLSTANQNNTNKSSQKGFSGVISSNGSNNGTQASSSGNKPTNSNQKG